MVAWSPCLCWSSTPLPTYAQALFYSLQITLLVLPLPVVFSSQRSLISLLTLCFHTHNTCTHNTRPPHRTSPPRLPLHQACSPCKTWPALPRSRRVMRRRVMSGVDGEFYTRNAVILLSFGLFSPSSSPMQFCPLGQACPRYSQVNSLSPPSIPPLLYLGMERDIFVDR